jgi:tRNA-Thr(GGU) m(6)t(6)A37 methyltransferase TsaA
VSGEDALMDDMKGVHFVLRPIGRVESPLRALEDAPMQGFEGAPEAWIVFASDVADACRDLRAGDEVFVLTWLHAASRDVQLVHPRDDATVPLHGVFSTRSPDRPNPIGLHLARVLEVDGLRARVADLEAIDGTPVIDVKPVLRLETDA